MKWAFLISVLITTALFLLPERPEELTESPSEPLGATTMSAQQQRNFYNSFAGITYDDRVALKVAKFVENVSLPRTTVTVGDLTYDIQVTSVEAITGGIQVFVRAWNQDGTQIGFGDGTVDIERFRIFNPPILVQDPAGPITKTLPPPPGAPEVGTTTVRYTVDPQRAILENIVHTISVMKNKHDASRIVPGKVGNTTSTFYPNANVETTSVDGCVASQDSDSGWANVWGDTTGQYPDDSSAMLTDAAHGHGIGVQTYGSAGDYNIVRCFTLFDTSAIPDTDTVSSAVVSLYGTSYSPAALDNDANAYITMAAGTPASDTAVVATDFDNVGTTQFVTGIALDSINDTAYNDFTLNASGIAAISLTGVSKFVWREGHDMVNDTPAFVASKVNSFRAYAVDQTGTTNDPKLVVEHAGAPAAEPTVTPSLMVID